MKPPISADLYQVSSYRIPQNSFVSKNAVAVLLPPFYCRGNCRVPFWGQNRLKRLRNPDVSDRNKVKFDLINSTREGGTLPPTPPLLPLHNVGVKPNLVETVNNVAHPLGIVRIHRIERVSTHCVCFCCCNVQRLHKDFFTSTLCKGVGGCPSHRCSNRLRV